jgi:hypothetical protein
MIFPSTGNFIVQNGSNDPRWPPGKGDEMTSAWWNYVDVTGLDGVPS